MRIENRLNRDLVCFLTRSGRSLSYYEWLLKSTLVTRVKMSKNTVFIYKDLGANENGCSHLQESLVSCLKPQQYSVQFITADKIKKETKLLNSAALIIFGAGYTTGFATALEEEGIRNLRDYVLNGGCYLGLGAGGYFGCDFIEFDKGGPLEKFSERELRFYPGVGRGPVYPGFKYGTHNGLHAAAITFNNGVSTSFKAVIDGGGAFYPCSNPKPGSEVTKVTNLAHFTELTHYPVAVVKTMVGKKGGVSVLSGVHLEYNTIKLINSDPELEHLRESFVSSKLSQINAFKSILKMFCLNVV